MAKFIVNAKGAIHSIPDGWPIPDGARPAAEDEIAAWYEAQGLIREVANGASEHGAVDQPGTRPDRRSRRN